MVIVFWKIPALGHAVRDLYEEENPVVIATKRRKMVKNVEVTARSQKTVEKNGIKKNIHR